MIRRFDPFHLLYHPRRRRPMERGERNSSMYRLFHLLILVLLIVSIASPAYSDYRIKNQTAKDVWVAYAAWRPWQPEGWRTWGWYKIKPRGTKNLEIPKDRIWVYIRVKDRDDREIKPPDHTTRERASFLIHPWKSFSVL